MISRIFIFWRFVLFLKWCSNKHVTLLIVPKFRSFLASYARFPRYGGLKFCNVLSVGKIWPSTPEYSGAIGWIAYKIHRRLPPHPRIIMLTYLVYRFKTRGEIAFSKSRKIIISRKIQRENNSLAGGNSVQTNNDGEMTMIRNDYDAKRPTTGAKWLWCEVAMMPDVRKPSP